MELTIEAQRIKAIREDLKQTQSQFAEELGVKSTTAEMERGRTRITGEVVMQLLEKYHINPLWLYGKSEKKYLNPHHTSVIPKVVSIDSQGNDNILLVSAKASAGYGNNIGDQSYYESLPTFSIPLPAFRNISFRGFQITGDSMPQLAQHNDWVLAKPVESLDAVKDDAYYVIVEAERIRLKKVKKLKNALKLISLNPEYKAQTLAYEHILEIWEYHSKLSIGVPDINTYSLENLYNEVQEIKKKLT